MKRHEDLEAENAKLTKYVGIMFLIIIICVPLLFIFYSRCEQLQDENEDLREDLETVEDELFSAEETISELNEDLDNAISLQWDFFEQCDFFDRNAGIVTVSGEKYHTYSCWHWRTGSDIWIFNIAEAEARGYEPCLDCH